MTPFFSVVMPTYNRSENIRPSIGSVLQQEFADFELIVVGDGCTDDTEAVVKSFQSPKITWLGRRKNSGGQAIPNNEGIAVACTPWICYLGHDDIWDKSHLRQVRETIDSFADTDFVVSGCLYYGPPMSDTYFVTGLFDSDDANAPLEHYFPPSSFCHRANVPKRIGNWRHQDSITTWVDYEFLFRAAKAGLRFRSTRQITVHKVAAGYRYLSYLNPNCDEQWTILRSLNEGNEIFIDEIIKKTKQAGTFMSARHFDSSHLENGLLSQVSKQNKGLNKPKLQPLTEWQVIEQAADGRGLDWHGLERGERPFRWSGPNPNPRILIPFTGGWCKIRLNVPFPPPACSLKDISITVDGRKQKVSIEKKRDGAQVVTLKTKLKSADYSVLTLGVPSMFDEKAGKRKLGVAISDIEIEPLSYWRILL